MPYFPPSRPTEPSTSTQTPHNTSSPHPPSPSRTASQTQRIRIKNRRKRYLDTHPSYFSPALELADPLLYDRLIRRFQTPAEREAEGRAKGYSGVLEADLRRSEAKLAALADPKSESAMTYRRGPGGEILGEEAEDVPKDREEGRRRWRWAMEMRFVRGEDGDFEYEVVDADEGLDVGGEEEREREEEYFGEEEPSWILDEGEEGRREVKGETGIQDF